MVMRVYEGAKSRLRALLVEAGFDFAEPRPALAWVAFKRFTQEYAGVRPADVGFECGYDLTRDDLFYFDLVNRLEVSEEILSVELRCAFTRPLTDELLAVQASFWSQGFDDIRSYFEEVEGLPEFRTCVELEGWRCAIE